MYVFMYALIYIYIHTHTHTLIYIRCFYPGPRQNPQALLMLLLFVFFLLHPKDQKARSIRLLPQKKLGPFSLSCFVVISIFNLPRVTTTQLL